MCLHSWGACSAPHLRKKSTTRSSVYSGISGSQRELFSSEMKRKRTICQVNRGHCSQRCQGPFVGRPLRSLAPSRRQSAYSKEMRSAGCRAGRLLQFKLGTKSSDNCRLSFRALSALASPCGSLDDPHKPGLEPRSQMGKLRPTAASPKNRRPLLAFQRVVAARKAGPLV